MDANLFRCICSAWGIEKVGKTRFGLTFPDPIHVINFDYGIEDLIRQFPNKEIIVHDIGMENPFSLDSLLGEQPQMPQMKLAVKEYAIALKSLADTGGTLMVDTNTQFRQLISQACLEPIIEKRKGTKTEGQIFPFDYAEGNKICSTLMRAPYKAPNINLVLIHRASPVYDEKGNDTGRVKMQGWHEVPPAMQVNIQLLRSPADGSYSFKIESCRTNDSLSKPGANIFPDPSFETLEMLLGD